MRTGNGKKGGGRLKLYFRTKYHNAKLPDRVGAGGGEGKSNSIICTRITYIIVLAATGSGEAPTFIVIHT